MRAAQFGTLIFALLLLVPALGAGEGTPLWKTDLSAFGYKPAEDVVLRFSNRFLVVYLGERDASPLVFDKETHQQVPQERLRGITLPPRKEEFASKLDNRGHGGKLAARWKQMLIEEVVTESRKGPDDREYYLHETGKESVLLFHGRCPSSDPNFVGDDYILLHLCNGDNVVANKQGHKVYDLPRLSFPYIVPSGAGTEFVVFERIESFFHQLESKTDKLRVKVFRSADGKKLFEYNWRTEPDDGINDGRVALSDDGLLVALVRGHETLIFAVPGAR